MGIPASEPSATRRPRVVRTVAAPPAAKQAEVWAAPAECPDYGRDALGPMRDTHLAAGPGGVSAFVAGRF